MADRSTSASGRTITTTAIGRATARPTNATVAALAEGFGPSPTAAENALQDRTETIEAALAETPAGRENVRAVSHRIEPPEEQFDTDADDTYRGRRRLEVDCSPRAVAEVGRTVIDAGGGISLVEFGLPEERLRSLREEAVATATEHARHRAERIAAVEGATVGAVRSISPTAVDGMSGLVEEALAFDPDDELQPSPITVTEEVEVVYDLAVE